MINFLQKVVVLYNQLNTIMMKYFFNVLFLILIASFFSCNSQSVVSEQNSSSSFSADGELSSKLQSSIVFLFFSIEKTADGSELVILTDQKITDGFAKNATLNDKEYAEGNILITFLGKDGMKISERIIEDPLNPEMEIYAEEGMNREKINLPKAEFSIRFNQTGNVASVLLEKINTTSKTKLTVIKL